MRNLFQKSLSALLFVFAVNWLFLYPSTIRGTPRSLPQTQLTTLPEPVLREDGGLRYSGYSKKPVGSFDDSVLKSSWRYKKWDFYSVFHEDITLGVAIADLGYVANAFAMVYEHGKEGITHETLILPFSSLSLSTTSSAGLAAYRSGGWDFAFSNDSPQQKTIQAYIKDILDAKLTYSISDATEGIVSHMPLNADGSQFFYSHKQYGYRLSGSLMYKGKNYDLSKSQTLGAMDWGRGVWPYRSFWIWASASGHLPDGRAFALNTGVFLGEFAQATDDFVMVGEKNIKLGVVTSPQANSTDPMVPWTFSTLNSAPTADYGSLSVTFTPEKFFNKDVNFWVIQSELQQIFGTFSGKATFEGGEVEFKDVRGWAERHLMRW